MNAPHRSHPGLLHNMSMRPNTEVSWSTGAVEGPFVVFALGKEARAALRSRVRTGRGRATLRAELDASWQACELRGAALLCDAISSESKWFAAEDSALVTNVLGRARWGLLLPEMPVELGSAFVARALWTDDPRLVTLARRSGARRKS